MIKVSAFVIINTNVSMRLKLKEYVIYRRGVAMLWPYACMHGPALACVAISALMAPSAVQLHVL